MPENWNWRTQPLQRQMRQRDVAALDAKKCEGLADAKAENDALRDDVAAGHRQLHIKAVCQSVREATTASGVDNATPRLADTAERDYFTLRERADHYAKTTGRKRSILMSSADRVAHIDGQLVQLLVQPRASSRCKCLIIKTRQSIYECLLGFCFNNIFCAATNFGCIDSFLLPNSETKKWWVMVSAGATAAGLLNSKRLLSTSL